MYNNFFLCFLSVAPFGYLYFSYFFNEWTRIGCRNQSWHGFDINHFHLVYWKRQDSNPQPYDHESSSLTTRPDLRPFLMYNYYLVLGSSTSGGLLAATLRRRGQLSSSSFRPPVPLADTAPAPRPPPARLRPSSGPPLTLHLVMFKKPDQTFFPV